MGSCPSDRPQDYHHVELPLNAVAFAGVAEWCASAADASKKYMVAAVMLQMMREGICSQK
jgi:hypothetical protein